MDYREYAPAPALAELVECYWSLEGAVAPGALRGHRVLPDGCADLVFHLAPVAGSPGELAGPRAHVAGPMSRAAVVRQAGEVRTWGVRLRPGALPTLLAPPAHELADRAPELKALWGPAARELRQRLGEAPHRRARVEILDGALMGRVRAGRLDSVVRRAVRALGAAGGNLEIADLSARTGLSTRQLQRRFNDAVGLSPKLLARILRFRAAVDALARDPDTEKGRLALRLGYYDQAHFGRDFRELAGVSPGGYLAERRDVAFVQAGAGDRGQLSGPEAHAPSQPGSP